jgi:hypothetical protein
VILAADRLVAQGCEWRIVCYGVGDVWLTGAVQRYVEVGACGVSCGLICVLKRGRGCIAYMLTALPL